MRWKDVFIAGTGAWFPEAVDAGLAVAEQRFDKDDWEKTGQISATAAAPEAVPAEFAITAGRTALQRAGYAPHDVGLLLHAVGLHSGIEILSSASYVQREIATARCLVSELRMACNGGLIGLELACNHLAARPGDQVAVITTADAWCEPLFDRWRSASGVVFADGGTAVVLSSRPGIARLVSLCTTTDPELEGMTRGNDPFGVAAYGRTEPVSMRQRAADFFQTMPAKEVFRRQHEGLSAAIEQALAEAEVTLAQIPNVVVTFLGRDLLIKECLEPNGIDLERTLWDFGRRIGHLGAGDQFAGLNHLFETGRLVPGEHVLLVGTGAGFTWSAAVLEVLEGATTRA